MKRCWQSCNIIDPVTTRSLPTTTDVQQLSATLEQYEETSATAVTESSTTVTDAVQPCRPTHSVMETIFHATTERLPHLREGISWSLAAVSTVLFVSSLTINIIMLWIYKKRQSKDNNVETDACEMEGNSCYEASNLKKTAGTAVLQ